LLRIASAANPALGEKVVVAMPSTAASSDGIRQKDENFEESKCHGIAGGSGTGGHPPFDDQRGIKVILFLGLKKHIDYLDHI
jgi:hypothetical protein